MDEQTTIADLLGEHKTLRQIAVALGRNPSTIWRELRRNTGTDGRHLARHGRPARSQPYRPSAVAAADGR